MNKIKKGKRYTQNIWQYFGKYPMIQIYVNIF